MPLWLLSLIAWAVLSGCGEFCKWLERRRSLWSGWYGLLNGIALPWPLVAWIALFYKKGQEGQLVASFFIGVGLALIVAAIGYSCWADRQPFRMVSDYTKKGFYRADEVTIERVQTYKKVCYALCAAAVTCVISGVGLFCWLGPH